MGEDSDGDSELQLVGTDSCEGESTDCTAGVFALKAIPKDPTPCSEDSCTAASEASDDFGIRTFRNYIYVTEGSKGH